MRLLTTKRFEKDFKLIKKRRKDPEKLWDIVKPKLSDFIFWQTNSRKKQPFIQKLAVKKGINII